MTDSSRDLCYVTVRIMEGSLEEERIRQCSEGVSQRQKEGKGVPSRGICMCRGQRGLPVLAGLAVCEAGR